MYFAPKEESWGSLLGQGINKLANQKLEKMHRAEKAKHIKGAFKHLTDEEIEYIQDQELETQSKLLGQYKTGFARLAENNQEQSNALRAQNEEDNIHSNENLQKASLYLQSPEAQQELTPEEIEQGHLKIQEKLQNMQAPSLRREEQQQSYPSFEEGLGAGYPTGKGGAVSQLTPYQEQMLANSNRVQERADRAEVAPVLEEWGKEYTKIRQAAHLAEQMRENLRKNLKHSWPSSLGGNLDPKIQAVLYTNPHYRKFQANAEELATLTAGLQGGNVTNLKLKTAQLAKAHGGQPIKTAESILTDIIEKGHEATDKNGWISEQGKSGKYPLNFKQKFSDYEAAKEDPLRYPDFYSVNAKYEDDDGTVFTVVDKDGAKQWESK